MTGEERIAWLRDIKLRHECLMIIFGILLLLAVIGGEIALIVKIIDGLARFFL